MVKEGANNSGAGRKVGAGIKSQQISKGADKTALLLCVHIMATWVICCLFFGNTPSARVAKAIEPFVCKKCDNFLGNVRHGWQRLVSPLFISCIFWKLVEATADFISHTCHIASYFT